MPGQHRPDLEALPTVSPQTTWINETKRLWTPSLRMAPRSIARSKQIAIAACIVHAEWDLATLTK
jgi:hypothetical protein